MERDGDGVEGVECEGALSGLITEAAEPDISGPRAAPRRRVPMHPAAGRTKNGAGGS